eukprot:4153399-Amphidinium_carterae.1
MAHMYRETFGMTQWMAPRRPDIFNLHAPKESGGQLAAPRQTDWQSLRRLSKCLETTEHYRMKLSDGISTQTGVAVERRGRIPVVPWCSGTLIRSPSTA